jgi:hypothetical protein
VLVLLALAVAAVVTLHSVSASRFDVHSRSIDIDICIHCTQPTDIRQTIVAKLLY